MLVCPHGNVSLLVFTVESITMQYIYKKELKSTSLFDNEGELATVWFAACCKA